jgi:hypothetical protein
MKDYKNIYSSITNNQQNLRELIRLTFLNLMSVQGVAAKTIIRNYNNKQQRGNTMNKKYLVKFNCIIGEYEHLASYIFDKRKTEWGYCKEYWGISKKDELKDCFWDDWMLNAIEVYSEKEITNDEAQQIQEWGLA